MNIKLIYGSLNLIICFCLKLSINSCRKDRHIEPYQISGRVFTGCPPQAKPDLDIVLFKSNNDYFNNVMEKYLNTKTDSNGYFHFDVDLDELLDLTTGNTSSKIISSMYPVETVGLEIYENTSTTLNMSLNVTNPYSSLDTLFIDAPGDTIGQQLKIAGPFHNGFVHTEDFYQFGGMLVYNYYPDSVRRQIGYHVNRNSNTSSALFNIGLCDTSYVTFDIK